MGEDFFRIYLFLKRWKCNAPIPRRGPARHGASVPLRSPVGNRRDTDVSLRHRIGKDDLCSTNMSRQKKNLTTTHAHSRKNARTYLTKSKLRLKNYKTSAGHKYKEQKGNEYKWLSQQTELTPLERTKKPKVPLSSSTQTRWKEVATPVDLPPRK